MAISTEKSISELLWELTNEIKTLVENGKKEGSLLPHKEQVQQWKLKDFEYTDEGVKSTSAQGEHILKDKWFRAQWQVVDAISKYEIYEKLKNRLKQSHPNFFEGLLDGFLNKICNYFLTNEKLEQSKIDEIINSIIKEINGEPIKSGIKVELVGITLRSKSIKINEEISIRQTQRSDLEIEIPEYGLNHFDFSHPYPSAIMNIEQFRNQPIDLQKKEMLAISILQLFKVGSIRAIRSHFYSDGFNSTMGGTTYTYDRTGPLTNAIIKESEEISLGRFWRHIESKIPESFYFMNSADVTFRQISFQRYEDALMKIGTIELRISNAIMGLEAIYLGGEAGELSYRLRLRISKILGKFGYDPFDVSKIIRDSYDIRSKFVHGGLLDYKEKSKIAEKYGDIKKLLEKLLDFLRISIVVTIIMQVGKDEFIDTLDKSFLDEQSEKYLDRILTSSKQTLSIT